MSLEQACLRGVGQPEGFPNTNPSVRLFGQVVCSGIKLFFCELTCLHVCVPWDYITDTACLCVQRSLKYITHTACLLAQLFKWSNVLDMFAFSLCQKYW